MCVKRYSEQLCERCANEHKTRALSDALIDTAQALSPSRYSGILEKVNTALELVEERLSSLSEVTRETIAEDDAARRPSIDVPALPDLHEEVS